MDCVLETRSLRKDFRGFIAVDDVSLRVKRGDIHAIIGPNGAGKTTVFNLLTKFHRPTAGAIVFNGLDITAEQPAQTARRGVVRSFQISAVFAQMTALENVRVALQRKAGESFHFWKHPSSLIRLNPRAAELLESVGLAGVQHASASGLPYGQKRALELATTLALEPEVLLLDEPTQGMGVEDVVRTTELIRRVAKDKTVLMVEHNMRVVSSIADRITVMQRGAVLAEGSYAEVASDPAVIQAYMGSSGVTHG